MDEQIMIIQCQLNDIQVQLTRIENKLNSSTIRLDEHINFIEKIYSIVRNPFSGLLSYYYGSEGGGSELPNARQIEN